MQRTSIFVQNALMSLQNHTGSQVVVTDDLHVVSSSKQHLATPGREGTLRSHPWSFSNLNISDVNALIRLSTLAQLAECGRHKEFLGIPFEE